MSEPKPEWILPKDRLALVDEMWTLAPEAESVWIRVDNIDVHIIRTDEGVVADLHSASDFEDSESLAGTWLTFDEAAPDEEEDDEPGVIPNWHGFR